MLKSIVVGSGSVPVLVEAKEIHGTRGEVRFGSVVCCYSRNNSARNNNVPKLEPFSRTKWERAVKDLPLIEKSRNDIADYCLTLEGDDCYSCWRAYFELKDLERESPKEDVEKLILQAGGMKSLIGCVHGISSMHKGYANGFGFEKPLSTGKERSKTPLNTGKERSKTPLSTGKERSKTPLSTGKERSKTCPIPDGLPKSLEEIEEEESGRLPDSPYTRLLRSKGRFPAWYTPAPDHETD